MCGITGLFNFDKNKEINVEYFVKNVLEEKLLSHRGPDDSGYWFDLKKKILNFSKNKKYNSNNLKNELSEEKTIKIFKKILLNKRQQKRSLNIIDYIIVSFFFLQKNYFYIRNKVYTNFYKIL